VTSRRASATAIECPGPRPGVGALGAHRNIATWAASGLTPVAGRRLWVTVGVSIPMLGVTS
jgi:hypothetical protein